VFGQTEDPGEIDQTRYTQPALFSLEYATARLWRSWGVRPGVLIGHSIGEIAAAAIAGLFCLEDAVALVAARARLMQSVSAPGGMSAVRAGLDLVAPLLAPYPDLGVAAVNAPEQCVVSGGRESLAALTAVLAQRGIPTRALPVSHAFHSPLMAEVAEEFRDAIADIRYHEPELTLVSNLTGTVARPAELASPGYWVRHLLEPVDFAAGMRTVAQRGQHAFLEVGPATDLIKLGRRCVTAADHLWLASSDRSDTDGTAVRTALTKLYTAGLPVSWTDYHAGHGRRIELPAYAFDRKRYWLPITGGRQRRGAVPPTGPVHHPLLGAEVPAGAGVREFAARLSPDRPAYLRDHLAMGQVVAPAAAYLETLLAACDAVYGETRRPIEDLRIHAPLLLSEDPTEVRTRLRALPDGGAEVEIVSVVAGPPGGTLERRHVTARIGSRPGAAEAAHTDLAARLRAQADAAGEPDVVLSADDLYAGFVDLGMAYGPAFQRVRRVARHGELAVGDLQGQDTAVPEHLPPTVLDAALQTVFAVADTDDAYLPVRVDGIHLLKKPMGTALRCVLRLAAVQPEHATDAAYAADLVLLEGDQVVCVLRGLRYRRVATRHRRQLHHEPRWIRRSARPGSAGGARPGNAGSARPRHLLVLGRTAADLAHLAGPAAQVGVRLSVATSTAEAAAAVADRPTDVCWFWRSEPGTRDVTGLRADCERNYRDLLDLLGTLEQAGFGRAQRLWLVTAGAHWLAGDPAADTDLAAATLWGFGQTLRTEYPAYRVTMLDLPPGATDYGPLLAEVLAAEPAEFQLAYRGAQRHVRRLYPSDPAGPEDDSEPVGDQIRVRVQATGLNYKDAMTTLGVVDDAAEPVPLGFDDAAEPVPLGYECAGTVTAAGPQAQFRPGDEVIVSHLGCLTRQVTVPSALAVRKPAGLGFVAAAGQATAYINAYHALHELARLGPGETVLIHAAAGGSVRPRCSSPDWPAPRCTPPPARTSGRSCASRACSTCTTRAPSTSPRRCCGPPAAVGSMWSSTARTAATSRPACVRSPAAAGSSSSAGPGSGRPTRWRRYGPM